MKRFQNRVALVTGGTSGIGKATAVAFAAEGARVVVAGRRETEGTAVVTDIRRHGGQATFVPTDVTRDADVRKLVDSALSSYERLDVAFNNAGTEGVMRPITEIHEQDWTRTIDVNLKGRGPGVGRQPSASVCSRFVVHSTLAIVCRCA